MASPAGLLQSLQWPLWGEERAAAATSPEPIASASPSLGLTPNFIADAAAKAAPAVVSIMAQPADRKLVRSSSGVASSPGLQAFAWMRAQTPAWLTEAA